MQKIMRNYPASLDYLYWMAVYLVWLFPMVMVAVLDLLVQYTSGNNALTAGPVE